MADKKFNADYDDAWDGKNTLELRLLNKNEKEYRNIFNKARILAVAGGMINDTEASEHDKYKFEYKAKDGLYVSFSISYAYTTMFHGHLSGGFQYVNIYDMNSLLSFIHREDPHDYPTCEEHWVFRGGMITTWKGESLFDGDPEYIRGKWMKKLDRHFDELYTNDGLEKLGK